MEIKKGYKQTEVGIIPEDWEVKKLGSEFIFKNGLNKNKKYFGYGTPIVNYLDVYRRTGIRQNDINGRVYLSHEEIKNYNVRKGDVLFTRTSETIEEIGISSVILEDLENTVFSGFLLRGRPINKLLDVEFCRYCFSSIIIRKQILATASNTTRALTSGKLLSSILIPIPPLEEQKRIAQVLSDTDALIEKLEQLIAKKQMLKQGAMQELLKPKPDWEVKKLGEVGCCLRGVSYNPDKDLEKQDKDYTIRLLRANNLQQSRIVDGEFQFIHERCVKDNQILQEGDILICMANGSKQLIGKSAKFKKLSNLKYTFGAFMGAFRIFDSNFNKDFIFYNFLSDNYRKHINILLSGSSINNLKPQDIESILIPIPPIEEQTRIAQILSDMDAEIEALEKEREKYKQIKQALMQELLKGRIRLI